ncbi:Regulator of nonsense transcripts 1 [Tritrichomonas foetus]|uniref:Regulator of nonsense transcripts 1 n=1 Tax=Tritrichomonas foetus TaxID=1144522 RepID=A0A1J4K0U0_9EUKA|nr:Regulator of nonsense transcripts 1 [Tritrichomonas foetus]|eukprot:OHT04991.1 Regulator of nonsense transcripts 1 [Tritrichomonas foetus]
MSTVNPVGWSMQSASQAQEIDREVVQDELVPPSFFSNEAPHCAYCLCNIEDCLVKCPTTGKYFCNGRGKAQHSHIVHHLVKSHNKEIQLLDSNQYSKIPLMCYQCQTRNIFQLCFVQSQIQKTFYIFCRDCLNNPQLAPYQFDMDNIYPIITDKSILSWLVRPPTAQESKQFFSNKISTRDMDLLEEEWEKNPSTTIMDLPQIKAKNKLKETTLKYPSQQQYSNVFMDLVTEECEYERKIKESMHIPNVTVNWEQVGPITWIARFKTPTSEALRNLNVSDELNLKAVNFDQNGKVVFVAFDGSIDLKFFNIPEPPIDPNLSYTVKLVFDDTSYRRQKNSLKEFANNGTSSTSSLIRNIILGKIPNELPRESIKFGNSFQVQGLRQLNQSQLNAIKTAIELPFTLIQGPPGTGKTTTIAALVYKFLELKKGPILVCGPSNISVEHATRYTALTGVNVVRVISRKLDDITTCVDKFTVSKMIFEMDNKDSRTLKDLQAKMRNEPLTPRENELFEKLKTRLEKEIIQKADVVCCTCDTAGSRKFDGLSFPVVIIDESTQAVEPKILIPILHHSKQVVLVGDHCQLGPNVMCRKVEQAGFSRSIVQRLMQLGMKPVRLVTQYRMHPALAEFPSNYFYEGILENGVSAKDRTPSRTKFPFPQPGVPMFFFNSTGAEESSDSGTSFINRQETFLVSQIISKLCKAGVSPKQIGVITPYAGQRCYIGQFLAAAGDLPIDYYRYIEVASVDSFQGGERDYIILSCVRSNERGYIGFLKDRRRMNVSLTRAKMGLMIIGSAQALSSNKMWFDLLRFFQDRSLLVEGEISHLKPSPIILQQPVVKPKEGRRGVPTSNKGKDMIYDPLDDENFDDFEQNDEDYYQTF